MLLLDEPLGALDLKLRRQMQVELKRIQTEVGLTFVHVTHDQEEAMTMADTIAVMNAGRIEQLGAPAELYENPATTFVANFLGQSNLLRGHRPVSGSRTWRRWRCPPARCGCRPAGCRPGRGRGLGRRPAGEDLVASRSADDPTRARPAEPHRRRRGHRRLLHRRLHPVPGAHAVARQELTVFEQNRGTAASAGPATR